MWQFYVVDSGIKLSVIYTFNNRLFQLISMQSDFRDDVTIQHSLERLASVSRDSRSGSGGDELTVTELSKKHSVQMAKRMNDRQTELLETISKHSLLICFMVMGNVIWFVWLAIPYGDEDSGDKVVFDVLTQYVFLAVNLLQLLCLYLGFPFAKDRYSRYCPKLHKLCQRYFTKVAIRETSRSIQNQYRRMVEDEVSSNDKRHRL